VAWTAFFPPCLKALRLAALSPAAGRLITQLTAPEGMLRSAIFTLNFAAFFVSRTGAAC